MSATFVISYTDPRTGLTRNSQPIPCDAPEDQVQRIAIELLESTESRRPNLDWVKAMIEDIAPRLEPPRRRLDPPSISVPVVTRRGRRPDPAKLLRRAKGGKP